jgi:hypothetical protein
VHVLRQSALSECWFICWYQGMHSTRCIYHFECRYPTPLFFSMQKSHPPPRP